MKKMILAAIAAAMITVVAPGSAAIAAPAAGQTVNLLFAEPGIDAQLVDDRRGNNYRRGYRDGRQLYTPGRRYNNAPGGWNRQGRRPGNWRSRGCILVGPIWFCP